MPMRMDSIMESRTVLPNAPGMLNCNFNSSVDAKSAPVQPNLAEDRNLLEALVGSQIFADYHRAFTQATGLPVALRSAQSWQLAHHGRPNEGPFCALMAEKSRSCGACLAVLEKLSEAATPAPHTTVCHAGLSESAVPVRLGDRLIGFLQTGQVFCKAPSERQFQRTVNLLGKWGVELDRDTLRKAYFGTRIVSGKQYASVVELLTIFAQHLSILSNQILVHRDRSESPVIAKAKAYIQEHHGEKLSLDQVAKAANCSRFHFCKTFKTATGLCLTDYVSRLRTERAKNLLLNPNLRVNEIAFEVGFQSITHFNRKFKDNFGQTPTRYRSRLWGKRS
jgi:AraC-like DNA-binding protein